MQHVEKHWEIIDSGGKWCVESTLPFNKIQYFVWYAYFSHFANLILFVSYLQSRVLINRHFVFPFSKSTSSTCWQKQRYKLSAHVKYWRKSFFFFKLIKRIQCFRWQSSLGGDSGREYDNWFLYKSSILVNRSGVPCFWVDSPMNNERLQREREKISMKDRLNVMCANGSKLVIPWMIGHEMRTRTENDYESNANKHQ